MADVMVHLGWFTVVDELVESPKITHWRENESGKTLREGSTPFGGEPSQMHQHPYFTPRKRGIFL